MSLTTPQMRELAHAAYLKHKDAMESIGWFWFADGDAWHSPDSAPSRQTSFVQVVRADGHSAVTFQAYQAHFQTVLGCFPDPVAAAMATQLV